MINFFVFFLFGQRHLSLIFCSCYHFVRDFAICIRPTIPKYRSKQNLKKYLLPKKEFQCPPLNEMLEILEFSLGVATHLIFAAFPGQAGLGSHCLPCPHSCVGSFQTNVSFHMQQCSLLSSWRKPVCNTVTEDMVSKILPKSHLQNQILI